MPPYLFWLKIAGAARPGPREGSVDPCDPAGFFLEAKGLTDCPNPL